MAKYENLGYCPQQWVPKMWDENTDSVIPGLWSLVSGAIVYQDKDGFECNIDIDSCNQMFGTDPIARKLLEAIVRRNVNVDKIVVHQIHNGACNTQKISDIKNILHSAINPELVVYAGSNYAVVLSDTDYGMDVYVWDLKACF